jgi:hypothetical protein
MIGEGIPPNNSITSESNIAIAKYKFPPKKRCLDGKNSEIKKKLDSYVDKMYEYKPAHSYHASIRLRLSGANSGIKSFFETHLETNDNGAIIFEVPTNYGTITLQKNRNMNCSNACMVKESLELMCIDVDKFTTSKKFMTKSKIVANADEIKLSTEFIEKTGDYNTRFEQYKNECVIFEHEESDPMSDEMKRIVNLISSTKNFMGELQNDARQYNIYYNKLKDDFKKESTIGTFPRNYEYRGITLNWNRVDISHGSMYSITKNYFSDEDFKNQTNLMGEFENQMNKLRKAQNKYKMNIFIDDEEYDV